MTEKKAGRVSIVVEPENVAGSEESDKRILTTMEEQGARLPVGILDGQALHKDIYVKPWRTREERELGARMGPNMNIAEHVSIVVSNMCSKLGPYNMDDMTDDQKSVAISTMYMCDVFYAYAWLRRKALGSKLRLNITCPRAGCGIEFPYNGLIDTIEVASVNEIDDILWTYKLENPITIRNKQVTHFRMAYPKWTTMEQALGNTNEADVKAITIQGTIVALNDESEPIGLTLGELDELSKIDFEGIQEGLNDHFLGPKMGVEGECSKGVCTRFKTGGQKFMFPINWRYQDFFGASSR